MGRVALGGGVDKRMPPKGDGVNGICTGTRRGRERLPAHGAEASPRWSCGQRSGAQPGARGAACRGGGDRCRAGPDRAGPGGLGAAAHPLRRGGVVRGRGRRQRGEDVRGGPRRGAGDDRRAGGAGRVRAVLGQRLLRGREGRLRGRRRVVVVRVRGGEEDGGPPPAGLRAAPPDPGPDDAHRRPRRGAAPARGRGERGLGDPAGTGRRRDCGGCGARRALRRQPLRVRGGDAGGI